MNAPTVCCRGCRRSCRRPEPEPDPEPELIESTGPEGDVQAPGDDRIRAKIADVIKTRVRQSPAIQVESVAPLTRGRGRGPDPLILNSGMRGTLPPEPPLTAAKRQEWSEEPPLVEPEARYDSFEQPDLPQPEPQPQAIQPRIPVAEPKKVVQHTQRRAPQPSSRAIAEAQPALQFEESAQVAYDLPPLSLLNKPANVTRHHLSDDALEENARMLETCWMITASRARSSRSVPARLSPCMNWSPRRASKPAV